MTSFQLATQVGPVSGVTTETLVVSLVILGTVVLLVTEWPPIDVTVITIMVTLIVLEPRMDISSAEDISEFLSSATITVLVMLTLSARISRTGIVQIVGRKISSFAGESLNKQLLATIGVTGPVPGFINNTPVVAILVSAIFDVAHKGKMLPSKPPIPLSHASQFGRMLTLIGTSTNTLASDTAARSSGEYPAFHAFDFFEFTILGVIVLLIGSAYLLTIGHRLLPERVPVEKDYVEEYEIADYLTEVVVRGHSPLVGQTVEATIEEARTNADILQLIRDGEWSIEPLVRKQIHAGDTLPIRASRGTLEQLVMVGNLAIEGSADTDEGLDSESSDNQSIVEVVIPSRSFLVGETFTSLTFRRCYDGNVPVLRSRGEVIRDRMDKTKIRADDTFLVQAESDSIDRMVQNRDFVLGHEADEPNHRTNKIPHAIVIMSGVIGLVAIPWTFLGNTLVSFTGIEGFVMLASLQQPILVTALGGVVAMAVAGVLKPNELYDSVDWDVTFLLAGVIPLGIAFEQMGAAMLLGNLVATVADSLPVLFVLRLFYIAIGFITEIISNNTNVVLMTPVAAAVATATNTNPFAFVLVVTFAASTAFLGPVRYQTNPFVYGSGGCKFIDCFRVGVSLQLLPSTVTVPGIVLPWGT